jgi:hypothetical protein
LWESLLGATPAARTKTNKHAISKSSVHDQSRTLNRILQRDATGGHAVSRDEGQLRATLEACEQLAIHFEHRARQIDRALTLTRHGLTLLNSAQNRSGRNMFALGETALQKWDARLTRRLERLETKKKRSAKILGIEMGVPRD